MKKVVSAIFLLIFFVASEGYCARASDFLKENIDNVLKELKDPKYQDAKQKKIQREEIWKIITHTFDFTEIAKRALARNWRKFSPSERKEFTDAFAELLGNTYLDKIQSGFKDEEIVYLSQKELSSSTVRIRTKIVRDNGDIPVDYNMKKIKDEWRVYDVRIEGISLVKNYRSQFNKLLFKESSKELIERLHRKNEQRKKKEIVGLDYQSWFYYAGIRMQKIL